LGCKKREEKKKEEEEKREKSIRATQVLSKVSNF
jgi:hypothetical protein